MTSTPNTSPASERVPEMVERVAKAICCPDRECPCEHKVELGCDWETHQGPASAAIAAVEQYLSDMSRKNDRLASHYVASFPEAAESIKALREALR